MLCERPRIENKENIESLERFTHGREKSGIVIYTQGMEHITVFSLNKMRDRLMKEKKRKKKKEKKEIK